MKNVFFCCCKSCDWYFFSKVTTYDLQNMSENAIKTQGKIKGLMAPLPGLIYNICHSPRVKGWNFVLCLFQISEINITEHIEGDATKFALWTGRAPISEYKIILKVSSNRQGYCVYYYPLPPLPPPPHPTPPKKKNQQKTYSKTSMNQTPIGHWPWLNQTCFWDLRKFFW